MTEITRRAETQQDAAFRFALFVESRPPHERLPGLDSELVGRLMSHQFAGQDMSYRAAFPSARHDIVEVDGVAVGRIVVDEGVEYWTIVDIALGDGWRGRGVGGRILAEVMAQAQAAGRPVRLRVLAHNPAARLYARLGFVTVASSEIDVEMVWPAPVKAPTLPDRLRLPLAFDAAAMAADVAALETTDWIAHFVPQNYDGDWSVLPLRGKASARHPIMMIVSDPDCRDYADTPFLAACPAIRAALARFGCPLQAVRLMRLGPGSIIKEHRDHDLAYEEGSVRIHVPIITNADVDFRLNGSRVEMAPGSAWYLRLADPHSVANRGTMARVHLVIDARVDGWVDALFASAVTELRAQQHLDEA